MIRMRLRIVTNGFVLLATLAALAGCIGKQSPEVSYYSLLSMEQTGATAATLSRTDLRIGIGPITLPEPLKRSQLVTRDQRNVYSFDEFNRWAGVLEKDIAYVLGDNLGGLLGVDKIAFFPWMPHFTPTHRVAIDIIQFDGEFSGEAVLSARWAIADAEGKVNLAGGKNVYRRPVEGGDYSALVKAESLLLAELSQEIARTLKALP